MTTLVKEDHLIAFLAAVGLNPESLTAYSHDDLTGLAYSFIDFESRIRQDPTGTDVYGTRGYVSGCKEIASRSVMPYENLTVRLAEQTIGRVINQLAQLQIKHEEGAPLARSVLGLLYAAGKLVNMMNAELSDTQYKEAVTGAQQRIVDARRSLDDVKKTLRTQGIAV